MKKIFLVLILGYAFTAQAQYGYGDSQSRRQNQMMQTEQKAPEPNFDVERYIGIVNYDIEKAAKKSSIKLTSKEGQEFSRVLTKYNKDIKDITRINTFVLRSTKDMVENYQKTVMKTGDNSSQKKVMTTMSENLKPISEILKKEDRELDKTIKALLSEKQYKKWIKYNRKIYKVFPKEEE
ncbi:MULTISPECIES: hypothetical protein [unclassified Polaribacter]|jgi:hypothetical protein|uniref:hypothetical protein n=1 Tax=unclassified Polaribacter TaxID=196858 RepID=UPI001C4F3090|nr:MULTISPECIES: hypothetical protein [unclassified Polaribacter]QXP63780.1 hypothetical protein H0I27_00840 [Polaribacter sp. HaHaR_3_91]QXP66282.1 hypothetical protein H0I28_13995 [Polaribacter sp. AHE13PA]QXP71776.1 hypothetical protein H0I29_06765 [Polaribacter sp. R2A056_3_33]